MRNKCQNPVYTWILFKYTHLDFILIVMPGLEQGGTAPPPRLPLISHPPPSRQPKLEGPGLAGRGWKWFCWAEPITNNCKRLCKKRRANARASIRNTSLSIYPSLSIYLQLIPLKASQDNLTDFPTRSAILGIGNLFLRLKSEISKTHTMILLF